MYYEGNITARIARFLFGAKANALSSQGGTAFVDGTALIDIDLKANTTEVIGFIGYRTPLPPLAALNFCGGAGYGGAAGEYGLRFVDHFSPSNDLAATAKLKRSYLVIRIETILQVTFAPVSVNLLAAYRFANAGVLKGPLVINGVNYGETNLVNEEDKDVSFDFSGALLAAGVSIEF